MTDLTEIKSAARAAARSDRKIAAARSVSAATDAKDVFLQGVTYGSEDVVALYCAIQSELDPRPLVEALWLEGITTCFPVVIAADTPLEFRVADRDTPFVRGAFGAAIPQAGSAIVTPSLIVAPLLSFDRQLYRLGYGGGFYDRSLQMLRANAPTRAYGYAFAAQQVEAVPIEQTDELLDGIVTETGLISA